MFRLVDEEFKGNRVYDLVVLDDVNLHGEIDRRGRHLETDDKILAVALYEEVLKGRVDSWFKASVSDEFIRNCAHGEDLNVACDGAGEARGAIGGWGCGDVGAELDFVEEINDEGVFAGLDVIEFVIDGRTDPNIGYGALEKRELERTIAEGGAGGGAFDLKRSAAKADGGAATIVNEKEAASCVPIVDGNVHLIGHVRLIGDDATLRLKGQWPHGFGESFDLLRREAVLVGGFEEHFFVRGAPGAGIVGEDVEEFFEEGVALRCGDIVGLEAIDNFTLGAAVGWGGPETRFEVGPGEVVIDIETLIALVGDEGEADERDTREYSAGPEDGTAGLLLAEGDGAWGGEVSAAFGAAGTGFGFAAEVETAAAADGV